MPNYVVKVETLTEYVEVQADNEEDARELAKEIASKRFILYVNIIDKFEVKNASNT